MSALIVIRLHPDHPIPGGSFSAYLSGLTVTAYDLSTGDPTVGQVLGSAVYVAPPVPATPWIPAPTTGIVQHFTTLLLRPPEAVATAVIEIAPPAGYKEYVSSDLRIEISRGGSTVTDKTLYYDIITVPGPAPLPVFFPDLDPSLYLQLPRPLSAGLASLDLSNDGTPPNFTALKTAVNTILAADQGPIPALAAIKAEQARHIAYEIVWGPQDPLPALPSVSVPANWDHIGALYTSEANDASLSNPLEQNRQQFEGNLNSYYATHNAQVDSLTRYVYALGAAIACEASSTNATSALLQFPVYPGSTSLGTTVDSAEVMLVDGSGGSGPLVPAFTVPAEYFYVLGAQLSVQMGAAQRFLMAVRDNQERLLPVFINAYDSGVIDPSPAINPAQAVRRLDALQPVSDTIAPSCKLDATVLSLVNDWLAFPGAADWRSYTPGDDVVKFWQPELAARPSPYLQLVLCALTLDFPTLIAAILALPVATVAALAGLSAAQWTSLFGSPVNILLLPPFTAPGTPEIRVAAFIRWVQKFFDMQSGVAAPPTGAAGNAPVLDLPTVDIIAEFVAQYVLLTGPFTFGAAGLNDGAVEDAAALVFPGDPAAQSWLYQRMYIINNLCQLATVASNVMPPVPSLAFSVAEALYARGFTSADDIIPLSLADFSDALCGTVAFAQAAIIYAKAAATGPQPAPTPKPFQPINPGGLVNCIPPCYLSPSGPVEYLHELLALSEASTCHDPAAEPPKGKSTLGDAIAARRGPLGNLTVTAANAETQIPLLDIVNENLENLAAVIPASPIGAVYDTASSHLGGHKLCATRSKKDEDCHPACELFDALPEHSAPAVPVAQPGAYDKLEQDFSAPALPYSEPLDICRSYLEHVGTCRFETMRTFRQEITEFALDPTLPAPLFQSQLWRYPVRIDTAIEYLGINPEEYTLLFTQDIVAAPTPGFLVLYELYGFDTSDPGGVSWIEIALQLPEFLKRTGLSYCELVDLQKSRCFTFAAIERTTLNRGGGASNPGDTAVEPPGNGRTLLPDCEPCCLEHYQIRFIKPASQEDALRMLAVFLRLWRKLQAVCGARYSFTQLCDICEVLQLFIGDAINPDFIRQLAAFQILRDQFKLKLDDGTHLAGAHGANRTHILALWVGSSAAKWNWAVDQLVQRIQNFAHTYPAYADESEHKAGHESKRKHHPQFIKLLKANLDPLSTLAGFDPANPTDTWHNKPAGTLRFAEVLAKMTASQFGIGEILYLFSADDHLDGVDPFPLQDVNDALDSPLSCPEDDDHHDLWTLRHALLAAEVSEEEQRKWSWQRVEAALRDEFGFQLAPGATDYLTSLAQHFFPGVLEHAGMAVSATERQYRVHLAAPSAAMWNLPPEGPFRFDTAASQLWTQLPLSDEQVVNKLEHLRNLTPAEQLATQNLYHMPRVDLAAFACFFPDFGEAERHLIEEHDEDKRWAWFRHQFALMYKRCHLIAEHLARHVAAATGEEWQHGFPTAWLLLKHLYADENRAQSTWEADSGAVPDVTWKPQPSGGAFAALLGLTGTGLLGEFKRVDGAAGALAWREMRGPMTAFDHQKNKNNAPAPTILPAMDLQLSTEQLKYVDLRNGFAVQDQHGKELGGAERFIVNWSGVLLVDEDGKYTFSAGAPTPDGEEPDLERAEHCQWRVTLNRGQKSWSVLHHRGHEDRRHDNPDGDHGLHDSHGREESTLHLKRGAYNITVEFRQAAADFSDADDLYPQHTGFQVKYCGADTHERPEALPLRCLFRGQADEPLNNGVKFPDTPQYCSAALFLQLRYTSSLRDIRRTYQRAFKALLFAHRFGLSGRPLKPYQQSELGYMLDHADLFAGASYYRNPAPAGPFLRHAANFDFNFLPLKDVYDSPLPAQDQRVAPTAKRRQALFDNWERMFDYTCMRHERQRAIERPVWLLFEDALEKQPDNPEQLLRHLEIDARHASLVSRYFQSQTTAVHAINTTDLEDDRWTVRVWHGDRWVNNLVKHFTPQNIATARPDLWAADDPGQLVTGEVKTGDANLVRFIDDGCLENETPRRYADVKRLNDHLRSRARAALIAYLCGMQRVALPWGGFASTPKELSALLLLDVDTGCCEHASRIEEAITAVQNFIQRARLGLEMNWSVSAGFVHLWKHEFASYRVWEKCKCRTLYKENWIDWDELKQARKIEAFQFLEQELRRSTLTIAVPGGLEYWPETLPPLHPAVKFLQQRDASALRLLDPPREGLGVLGTPERDARPSWLAPDTAQATMPAPPGGLPNNPTGAGGSLSTSAVAAKAATVTLDDKLPFWIQAAIRLGTKFVRVAAGGVPPAAAEFHPSDFHEEPGCCNECGCAHPPLMDEYYFWLVAAQVFNAPLQDEYYDPIQQASTYWHDDDKLPALLDWKAAAATQLAWCRVHNGEFKQPRRADGLVQLTSGSMPDLAYVGRTGDSLTFSVTGGAAPTGYHGTDAPGFRYDMAADACVTLPLVADAPATASPYPAGLPAYPYFAFVEPGDCLFPASLFSPALSVAGVLRCHCRFEPALKWYQLVSNPLLTDNSWVHCLGDDGGNQPPAANLPPVTSVPPAADITPAATAAGTAPARTDGGMLPAAMCCDSTHISAEAARNRSVLLHYLETLVEWSRALMRQNSRESAQQARLVLDTAAMILGACPRVLVNYTPAASETVATFTPLIPPLNPRLMALYCDVNDGLALVHHCMSEARLRNAGTCGPYGKCGAPYFGQDPCRCATLEQHCGCEAMQEPCCDDDEWCRPHSPYRFVYLLQKAQEASGKVRELSGALLSAFNNGDAEFLASIRARHETQLADMTINVRQNQWRDADWQVQALGKTKEVSQTNRRFYKHLIDVGLNNGELNYQSNTNSSLDLRSSAIPIEATGEAMRLIPDLFVGFPCEETWLPLGTKLGEMFQAIARITNEFAEIASVNAGLDLTQASWQRRLDDWVHQVEILDIEIEQEEIQILGAERRRDSALEELNIQQTQFAQSREVLDALRDKFTSHELYLYLQKETAALHWQMFELARYLAVEAQRAFNFELGYTKRQFVVNESWDNLHEGLQAGERLQLALQQMETEYVGCNRREYELTKHISLALHFPLQFLRLKITGSCEIEIPEWMFDMDYPGQYLRRIKNVSLTIPCVTGPYTGVHCRLTLLSSQTRIDPCLPCPVTECCHDKPRNSCGCSHGPHEHYALCGADQRAVRHYGAKEAIATSSGRSDAGLFELNFHDERHLPFEFLGAVSCWRIEMPPENNYFDMDSLTDVVVHMNYTAREGGIPLRQAASASAQQKLPGNGWILIDLRKDYPDAWELFQRRSAHQDHDDEKAGARSMRLPISRKLFPFLPADPELRISKLAVLFELEECGDEKADACPEIDACPCAHDDVQDCQLVEVMIDHADDDCDDASETEINCVTSAEWPKLYHGVAEVDIGPIRHGRKHHSVTLTLDHDVSRLKRAFILCRYETVCACCETVRPVAQEHAAC
ncbi:MAG: neuraminidase-like domain-containing protein [Collimonas sp.]|uniref:Tc toxin subunit A-related protein n=1 Tax=Collimonas sp. TaxID=1963772 RepID=UPI0032642111